MARTRTRNQDQPDESKEQEALTIEERRQRRRKRRKSEAEVVATPQPVQMARKDRPTPSAREVKARGVGSTGLINRIPVVRSIAAYLRGVSTEMKKVTWPSREETTRLTGVVLSVTIAFAIALGALNTFLTWWFQQAFDPDSEAIFLGIAAAVAVVVGGTYTVLRKHI